MAVSKRARAVWKRLGQSYGTRMADTYGEVPPSDWCRVIDRTDPERLERALVKVREVCIQFPPTLGQFEAAIPKKQFGKNIKATHEQLCDHALRTLNLCEHQLWPPWTYFGKAVEDGSRAGYLQTNGVVIPACYAEGCHKYGKSHRILATDLP